MVVMERHLSVFIHKVCIRILTWATYCCCSSSNHTSPAQRLFHYFRLAYALHVYVLPLNFITTIFLHFTLASVAFRAVKDNPRLVMLYPKNEMRWDVGNWKIRNYNAIHEAEETNTHTHTHSIILLDFIKFYVKTSQCSEQGDWRMRKTHLYSGFRVISWFMSAATGNDSFNKYVHLWKQITIHSQQTFSTRNEWQQPNNIRSHRI